MKAVFRTIAVGFLMGAVELVPGVSGGTVAFVSGLYERLVNGIRRLTPSRRLFRFGSVSQETRHADHTSLQSRPQKVFSGARRLWQRLDLTFLTLLFTSMGCALLLLARVVGYLLEFQPVMIWSFFFGLVLASVWVITDNLRPLTVKLLLAVAVGMVAGLFLSRMTPIAADISPLVLFVGGCIAVCAWILPGLSGSYVLLILGLYQTLIFALEELEFSVLIYVALGCVVGILSFSHLLGLLLENYRNLTVATLMGLMTGSLAKVWPWKYTVSYQIGSDGNEFPLVQNPVLPEMYQILTGKDPELVTAGIAFVAGLLVILLLDRLTLLNETVVKADGDGQ